MLWLALDRARGDPPAPRRTRPLPWRWLGSFAAAHPPEAVVVLRGTTMRPNEEHDLMPRAAARASRRKRAQTEPVPLPSGPVAAPALRWRLRVVDEPPLPGDEVLRLDAAANRTSVLASTGRSLRQTLAFEYGADGAASLLVAAAAYQRLARAADTMAAAGGLLVCVDDGRLHISYGRS
jgi:hypothetical protein